MTDLPTGGTITAADIGGTIYRIHTFLADGDFVVPAGQSYSVEHLLIGGGGGALTGTNTSVFGGAGAGGLLENIGAATNRSAGTYAVVVGAGGIGSGLDAGKEGGDTTAFSLTAFGGGGPRVTYSGFTDSVGSGAGGRCSTGASEGTGQEGTVGQGFDGYQGVFVTSISTAFSGPGGGQNNGDFEFATDGAVTVRVLGEPIELNMDGQLKEYGTGGAGGSIPFQASLLKQNIPSGVDQHGEDGTGGGAGADTTKSDPKNGGSGIAIFRYPTSELPGLDVSASAQEQTNDTASFDVDVENEVTLSSQEQYGADAASAEILVTQYTVAVAATFRDDPEVTGVWRRADAN